MDRMGLGRRGLGALPGRGVAIVALALLAGAAGCDELTGAGSDDIFADGRSNSAAVVVSSLTSADAVRSRYAAEATTPEGAVKMWLTMTLMASSRNLSEHRRGRDLLGELTPQLQGEPSPWWTRNSTSTFADRLNTKPYIFGSYAVGANPTNGYAIDANDWTLNVESSAQDNFGRGWRVSIRSGGADSSRPVYLMQQGDLWYVNEFANTYVDIRPPQ